MHTGLTLDLHRHHLSKRRHTIRDVPSPPTHRYVSAEVKLLCVIVKARENPHQKTAARHSVGETFRNVKKGGKMKSSRRKFSEAFQTMRNISQHTKAYLGRLKPSRLDKKKKKVAFFPKQKRKKDGHWH